VCGSDDPGSVDREMSVPNVPELREPLPPPPPPAAPMSPEVVPFAGDVPTLVSRRRTLTPGWRWVLACGWGTVMAGIGVVANTGFVLGDPPFWTSSGLAVVPFVVPVLVLVALAGDWRYTIPLSFAAVASTMVVAVIDLFGARPMGLGELIFAVVGLLVTISAMAGLVPQPSDDHRRADGGVRGLVDEQE
jgi:hypothetical protein